MVPVLFIFLTHRHTDFTVRLTASYIYNSFVTSGLFYLSLKSVLIHVERML